VTVRIAAATALCASISGCGSTAPEVPWAEPQEVPIARSVDCGRPGHDLHISVERLQLRRRSWRVEAEIVNRLGAPVVTYRAHHLGPATSFGLSVFSTSTQEEVAKRADDLALRARLVANRFEPFFPTVLAPGRRWRGSFTGPGHLPPGRYVRIVFARFRIAGEAPAGMPQRFICVSAAARPR
jgi:hypothetical protein